MNTFMNALKEENNFKVTENGATAKKSTMSKLYDLFALGGAYRSRTESDCVLLFKEAFEENQEYAMKCLTYLRDILEGQGERRFFRVCLHWLGMNYPDAAARNLVTWVKDGFIRWDDLFVLLDTPAEKALITLINHQLIDDMTAYNNNPNTPVSLCGKWLPSENTSSIESRHRARKIITALNLTPREYRKMLSKLRERINIVERLMSQNRWDEIDFSKIPSRAGLLYRNAFKNHDIIAEKYKAFAEDKDAEVNAKTLYPYDVVAAAKKCMGSSNYYWNHDKQIALDNTERLMINKYWDNLTDYFKGATLNAMVVCDTSGSMLHGTSNTAAPIDVAVSLALYTAEHAKGPFANHYISFSHYAQLIETVGVDFCDKVDRIISSNLCENTNLESVFGLVLDTAMRSHVQPEDLPEALIVVSDMEVDEAVGYNNRLQEDFITTMQIKWDKKCHKKYKFPKLYFWNVNARNNTFLTDPKRNITFLSGCSPILYEQILKGLSGMDLMFEKLNSDRYKAIS